MRRELTTRHMVKPLSAGQRQLTLPFFISTLPLVHAQKAAVATRPAMPFSYDISKEIKLNGTVSSVLAKPSPGMLLSSHLLFATASGAVDASMGRFALLGKNTLSITPGQYVEVTGVIASLKGQQVWLTCIVKVDYQVYTIGNKRGFALSPQARDRLSQSAGQKGEQL